jgi:hypothetical protein
MPRSLDYQIAGIIAGVIAAELLILNFNISDKTGIFLIIFVLALLGAISFRYIMRR